ncbi:MAG: hypothetical protein EOM74_05660, partial [Methanomicrobia archaeon]|nr:hypothetical protein [Methanomicrobia archaeon]
LDEESVEITPRQVGEIKVDDYVSIVELGIVGRVERISGEKVYIISPDGLRFTSSKDKVLVIEEPRQSKVLKPVVAPTLNVDVKLELNVIGLYVDEALQEVGKYLDGVRLKHYSQVRIIHGFGTGALKRAIQEYLKKCDFVDSFRSGDQHEGGGGATVVKLK